MLCKECGADVNSNEVFCPVCGSPLRVTADYDYIQAEIGVKVDQVLNNDPEDAENVSSGLTAPVDAADDLAKTRTIPGDVPLTIIGERSASQPQRPRKKTPEEIKKENTIAVTRTLFIKDSIFADEETPDTDDEDKEAKRREQERSYRASRDDRKRRAEERARKKRRRLILIIIAAVVVVAAAVGIIIGVNSSNSKQEETLEEDQIACSVQNGGTYAAPLEITLWSDQDSRLVYTLDGTEPGVSTGTKYGQPISLTNEDVGGDSREITLIVYAYKKDASIKVGELRLTFTLTKSVLAPPVFDLEGGDYYEPTYITISAGEGMTIYYTYDGSTPTLNSTKYTEPIEMKRGNNILSAITADSTGTTSEVTSAVYNLVIWSNISYDEAFANVLYTLQEQGLISSTTPDENGYYAVPDGGTRRVINGGEAVIDNTNYYVIQVDYMNDGSNVQATTYFGVNDQTGNVYILNRSGMTYILA